MQEMPWFRFFSIIPKKIWNGSFVSNFSTLCILLLVALQFIVPEFAGDLISNIALFLEAQLVLFGEAGTWRTNLLEFFVNLLK